MYVRKFGEKKVTKNRAKREGMKFRGKLGVCDGSCRGEYSDRYLPRKALNGCMFEVASQIQVSLRSDLRASSSLLNSPARVWAANSSNNWTVSAGLAIQAVVQANLAYCIVNIRRKQGLF